MPETTSATATAASSESGSRVRSALLKRAHPAARSNAVQDGVEARVGPQVVEVRVVLDPLEVAATVLDGAIEHLDSVVDVTQDRVGAGDVVAARECVRPRLQRSLPQDHASCPADRASLHSSLRAAVPARPVGSMASCRSIACMARRATSRAAPLDQASAASLPAGRAPGSRRAAGGSPLRRATPPARNRRPGSSVRAKR